MAPIELVETSSQRQEFVDFYNRVYAYRRVRWPSLRQWHTEFITEKSDQDTQVRAFLARRDGSVVARVAAVIDGTYNGHWAERAGHLVLFEALPDARSEAGDMLEKACKWLQDRQMAFARAGFYGLIESPFVIDDYSSLPPIAARQNPAYYHAFLKAASFFTEKGWVDYQLRVNTSLLDRWRSASDACMRQGYDLRPVSDIPRQKAVGEFSTVYNDAFRAHWGCTPMTDDDTVLLFFFLNA